MPKLGHNIKKIKTSRFDGVMKFGEIEKTELTNVYVEKFYPSGYIMSDNTYQADGSGGGDSIIPDGLCPPSRIHSLLDWLKFCRESSNKISLVNYTTDDKGNCTMTATCSLEDGRKWFAVAISEYEYY